MSKHNQWNSGGGSVKELLGSYLYGLREEFEDATAEAEARHKQEFATKAELHAAITALNEADDEQMRVLQDFIQQVERRFNGLM